MKSILKSRKTQRGAVLLVLFLIVFSVAASVFLSSVNTHSVEVRQLLDVRTEMGKSKQALIAYARNYHNYGFDNDGDTFTDDEGPGRLICPDVDNDSFADSTIAQCTDNVRGRLPETFTTAGSSTVTVTLNDYFSDVDQQFWYVVSPAFKEITTTQVNHLTAGTLSIDGVPGYVAVIIAPGEALAGQDRSASSTTAANYLEQDNLAGTSFINSYTADPDAFNDQVIGITAAELNVEIVGVLEPTRQALYNYYAANTALPVTWPDLLTYMEANSFRWFLQEGYSGIFSNYFHEVTYPYIRYNINGCATRWYWFIPPPPYNPNIIYQSGAIC